MPRTGLFKLVELGNEVPVQHRLLSLAAFSKEFWKLLAQLPQLCLLSQTMSLLSSESCTNTPRSILVDATCLAEACGARSGRMFC